ncbi:MAG: AAA family ATPase [Candidatus Aenigmarchaeota archaeon]|nr:AAA family ATPase [Candidatus Aenigmarchaeota archaeon]
MDILLPEPFPPFLGPLEPGAVTNLYGEPGSGKTNLCLLATLACIQQGGTVTYLDTEGGFSFARLEQLFPGYKSLLPKINLLQPKDFADQGRMIRALQGTDLVVVDSLSALYRLEFTDNEPRSGEGEARQPANGERRVRSPSVMEANRELSRQLSLLSALARARSIPVLVTSHAFRQWDSGKMEVVGGDAIRYWSKTLLFLEKTSKPGERKATIIKHRSRPEGEATKFLLTQDGIAPAGFRLF